MSQTSYTSTHAVGYEGDKADSAVAVVSGKRNNSGAALPFGRALVHDAGAGTSELAVKLPSAMTDKVVGFNLADRAREACDGVADDAMINNLRKGRIYVAPEDAVTPASSVFVRFGPGTEVDGARDAAGKVRTDGDVHTAWVRKTAYSLKDRRSYNGKVYKCITAGTTEDAADPSGIVGAPTGADITDGTAHWQYLGVCDASTRASAFALTPASFASSAAAGEIASLELNLP